jgi:kynurenine formamidase
MRASRLLLICFALVSHSPQLQAQTASVPRDTFDVWMTQVSNAGRWGASDSLGTLNFITNSVRLRAIRGVHDGMVVSLARSIVTGANINAIEPLRVQFTQPRSGDIHWFLDAPTLPMHGWAYTHMDALSHAAFKGTLYNRIPDSVIDTVNGASKLGMQVMANGIVARGVLIDVPWLRGVAYLDTSAVITAADLIAWERRTGTPIEAGDAVLIRTGRGARERALGTWPITSGVAGLHPNAARWLHDRRVAVLGSDVSSEHYPSLVTGVSDPIHQLALTSMGMPLIDDLDLEALAAEATRRHQSTFLLMVSPLPVRGASGSLVNPLAVF